MRKQNQETDVKIQLQTVLVDVTFIKFLNTLNIKNMKTLFFILAFAISVNLYSQETAKTGLYYCIQVVSTENPERLQPIMFMAMMERAMIEKAIVNGRLYYRGIFIYKSVDEQDSALHNWKHQWANAIRVTKTAQDLQKMYPLFTYD